MRVVQFKSVDDKALDWEVEIVAVIGKTARQVTAADAMDHVFGFTATQDLTAKDWAARNGGQLVMSKNFDAFCPLGPCVVTKEEFGDLRDVRLRTWVNGELKQDGNSANMVHGVPQIIEYLTRLVLEPFMEQYSRENPTP
ncbi:unnamed protein product [Phaedon cochleariae]|uniref:Fumarylacetoacetase-like C-terminal domain-containing protein n=1 Tax=Phaedon cochleariae TaxID=80249 RepID=A0A9N9X1W2_PHACE|nr:unnamed protein product [Phaedon cochleariae]